jgi:elongation factor Ts
LNAIVIMSHAENFSLRAVTRILMLSRFALRKPYSTKSTIQLVADLRKATNAPIVKARQALSETGNNFAAALRWLEKDLSLSGAEKAAKIKGRTAGEGVISICVLNDSSAVKAAMIELNCETDFVARTEHFTRTADRIAHLAANLPSKSVDELMEAPLGESSVQAAIADLIGRTGENITLARAATLSCTPVQRMCSYVHNASAQFPFQGRIGGLALLSLHSPKLEQLLSDTQFVRELEKMERALARQVVGFSPLSIDGSDESALYKQQFIGGDKSVLQVLTDWQKQWELDQLQVDEFVRWEVGRD